MPMKMKPATAIALSIALHVAAILLIGMILRPIFRAFAFSRSIVYADLVGADKVSPPPAPAVAPTRPAPWEIAPSPPPDEGKPPAATQPPAPAAPAAQPAPQPPSPPSGTDNAAPGAPLPATSVTGILQGRRLADAFGGMARQQQLSTAAARFQRKAPAAVSQLVREAQPPGQPFERGHAKVVLPAGPDGKALGKVAIGPGAPWLEKTLGRVAWDKAPLPWREGIPSGAMTLEISVEGDRVDVKIEYR